MLSTGRAALTFCGLFPPGAEALTNYFTSHGILVRPKYYQGKMGLRITVGTREQVTRLTTLWEDYEATRS